MSVRNYSNQVPSHNNHSYYNIIADEDLNLDTLLIHIGSHITSKWYEFGRAAGVSNEILDKCLGYPSEQCIIEVLDYWLRSQKKSKPTWKDVSEVLKVIQMESLAEDVLNFYKTGK